MLKPAQLYENELRRKELESWYDLKNMYYRSSYGSILTQLADNNYEQHQFVSVDEEDNVIGYIYYRVDWSSMSASHFGIISFDKGNLIFINDVYHAVCDIFEKYNMNRICWSCYTDNPAVKWYREFIKKHGGVECGYYREVQRLMDGKLHDACEFEILKREFKR